MSNSNYSLILPCNTSSDVVRYLHSTSHSEILSFFSETLDLVISQYKGRGFLLDLPGRSSIDCSVEIPSYEILRRSSLLRDVYNSFGRSRSKYLMFLSEVFRLVFPHFSFSEIFASPTADIHGISNLPFKDSVFDVTNLIPLLSRLESIRKVLNMPIYISSGFRCPKLNKKVGGVGNSRHQYFRALDIVSDDMDNLYELCRSDIFRYVYRGTGYIHIDI